MSYPHCTPSCLLDLVYLPCGPRMTSPFFIGLSVQNTRACSVAVQQSDTSAESCVWCACGMSLRKHSVDIILGAWSKLSSARTQISAEGEQTVFFQKECHVRMYVEPYKTTAKDQQMSRGIKLLNSKEAANVDCFPIQMRGTSNWGRSSIQRFLESCSGFYFSFPDEKLNVT